MLRYITKARHSYIETIAISAIGICLSQGNYSFIPVAAIAGVTFQYVLSKLGD